MKLLIVDDEIISVQAILQGIDQAYAGISEVRYAVSLSGAQKVYEEYHPDVMLLDIEMSGGTGLDFLSWVREQQDGARVRCAFLTCHPEFNYAVDAIRLGARDYVLKPPDYPELNALLKRLADEARRDLESRKLQRYGEQWVTELEEKVQDQIPSGTDARSLAEETASYIVSHLSEKLLLQDLAERVHLNPDYLNRVFKKYKEVSISQFIIRERMEMAKTLLEKGNLTAYAVSEAVGYQSYPHFASTFRRYFGMNPGQAGEQGSLE